VTQVTQQPQGLIAALGLRDMGATPRELSPTIAPTVDMLPLYLIGQRTSLISANAAVGVGNVNFTDLVVPIGELWYVHEYSVVANLDATEACTYCAAVNFDGQAYVPTSDYLGLGVAGAAVDELGDVLAEELLLAGARQRLDAARKPAE
jgi:hypothetical protein